MKRTQKTPMTEEERKRIAGHRKRLRKRFLTQRSDDIDDSRLLELLLTYAIPRIDVYPLAINLLIKFGDLDNVISASIDELCSVEGIGENTAILIKMIPTIVRKSILAQGKRTAFKSSDDIGREMCRQFFGINEERVLIALFNASNHLLTTEFLPGGKPSEVQISQRALAKIIVRDNVAKVAIAHNHPNGDIKPSLTDMMTMQKLKSFTDSVEIKLIDVYIVNDNSFFKMSDAAMVSSSISDKIDTDSSLIFDSTDTESALDFTCSVFENE